MGKKFTIKGDPVQRGDKCFYNEKVVMVNEVDAVHNEVIVEVYCPGTGLLLQKISANDPQLQPIRLATC